MDAATFANAFNAFWNAHTPTCEHFTRRLNSMGLRRFRAPKVSVSAPDRRAIVAEYAFSLFVERKKSGGRDPTITPSIEESAWRETERRLRPYASQGLQLGGPLGRDEDYEARELSTRLVRFFNHRGRLILRPIFAGCGFIDKSEGDVISGHTLFEVKTVDRPFRSSDVRQTITYAALNSAAGQFNIEKIGLVNPRRGLYCDMNLDIVCDEISGRSSQDLLALIVQTISSGEISR